MTPLEVGLILGVYCGSIDLPESLVRDEAIRNFVCEGIITLCEESPCSYKLTGAGNALLHSILNAKRPRLAYLDENDNILWKEPANP